MKIGQTASTTFPIVISQSGSYVLTSNIVVSTTDVNGIEIGADTLLQVVIENHCSSKIGRRLL